ncbi:hypothetical protein THASP1DRAFT_32973, partial [Thamnocephalis sphaerospora]
EAKVRAGVRLPGCWLTCATQSPANPFEVHIIAIVTGITLITPEHLHDAGERPLALEVDELQVECRNTELYLDLLVSTTPIKISRSSTAVSARLTHISGTRSTWEPVECIFVDDLAVRANRLCGPMPTSLTYVCHWEIDVGRIHGRVRPAFLDSVISFVSRLDYQMDDFENALPRRMCPSTYPDVTFLRIGVRQLDLTVWGSQETATQIALEEGLSIELHTLIGEKYSKCTRVAVSHVLLRSLAATRPGDRFGETNDVPIWAEVAYVDTSVDLTAYVHTSDWYERRESQRNFLRDQDRETKRCAFLYDSDADTVREDMTAGMSRPDHQGCIYIPPFQPSFAAENDMTDIERHRHSMQSHSSSAFSSLMSTNYGPAGNYESDSSSSEEDDEADEIVEDTAADTTLYQQQHREPSWRGHHSIKSSYTRSISTRRSSNGDSFRTAWDDTMSQFSRGRTPRSRRATNEALNDDEVGGDDGSDDEENEDEDDENTSMLLESGWFGEEHEVADFMQDHLSPPSNPLSIPYYGYLRRFRAERRWHPGTNGNCYVKPHLPTFVHENEQHEGISESTWRPSFYNMWRNIRGDNRPNSTRNKQRAPTVPTLELADDEKRVTVIVDMRRSIDLLVTPVFLRIVCDLLESLDSQPQSPTAVLDALQMSYMARFFKPEGARRVNSTLFAISIPCIHLNAIQDVALPADLTSYDGYLNSRIMYDLSGTLLCAAEFILDDMSAYVFKRERALADSQPSVEAKGLLSLGTARASLRFVSSSQFTGIAGIPKVMCSIETPVNEGKNEPVVVSFIAESFLLRFGGGGDWNDTLSFSLQSISATCVHQAIEIVAGAVYSWLSFVDDLSSILAPFAARMSARRRILVAGLADVSANESMSGSDAAFLTRPSIAWRLCPPVFQSDAGWRLLARLRRCVRTLSNDRAHGLKQRLKSPAILDMSKPQDLRKAAARNLSRWLHWDETRDGDCALLDVVFDRPQTVEKEEERVAPYVALLQRLMRDRSAAIARIVRIHVCVYEPRSENNIVIGPIVASVEAQHRAATTAAALAPRRGPQATWAHDALHARIAVVARLMLQQIDIDIAPSMLSLIKHVLEVQRSFAANQRGNLSQKPQTREELGGQRMQSFIERTHLRTTATPAAASQNANDAGTPGVASISEFVHSVLARAHITAQLFFSLQHVSIAASAQDILLRGQLNSLNASAQLSPLTRPGLPSWSALGSVAATMRRCGAFIQEQRSSTRSRSAPSMLVQVEISRISTDLSTRLTIESPGALPQIGVVNLLGGVDTVLVRVPQSILKLYHFVEDWKTDNLPTYDFLLHRIRNEWEQTRWPADDGGETHVAKTAETEAAATAAISSATFESARRIRAHLLLGTVSLQADTLPSLSVAYTASQLMVALQPEANAFDLQGQLHSQEIGFSARHRKHVARDKGRESTHGTEEGGGNDGDHIRRAKFLIPAIRVGGRYAPAMPTNDASAQRRVAAGIAAAAPTARHPANDVLDVVAAVDFVNLTLDADLIDKAITIQGLLGNEINDALEVFLSAKSGRQAASKRGSVHTVRQPLPLSHSGRSASSVSTPAASLVYSVNVAFIGSRITAVSPAAAMLLESDVLRGQLTNRTSHKKALGNEAAWKVVAKGLTLSLCHRSAASMLNAQLRENDAWRSRRLAFILLDFDLQNFRAADHKSRYESTIADDDSASRLFIKLHRAHAVMQPVALGKLVDFAVFYTRGERSDRWTRLAYPE